MKVALDVGDQADRGGAMMGLIRELFPFTRSITGAGVRATLEVLRNVIPLSFHEVPTGTAALDWTVPREWTIREAWIEDPSGHRIVDMATSNLHVLGYSVPVRARMSMDELRPHLHSLPDRPSWIPYRTSYYDEAWGFCMAHEQLLAMGDGPFEVCIDSELKDGSLTYGELVLPGEIEDEILISTHICHPSMANDNLSGIAVATFLAAELQKSPRRHTIRFLFVPGTIGSLTWLALHDGDLKIRHGIALAGVGDAGNLTYKRTRRGTADVDRAAALAFRDTGVEHAIRDFSPWGYDERQYNSPGFNLPVGLLGRTPHGTYPEYHTSADDLDFVRPASLEGSLDACRAIVDILDANRAYRNLSPKGEPALGRRGLYAPIGGSTAPPDRMATLWVLNQSDGAHTLLDIAERSGLPFAAVADAARALEHVGLLAELPRDGAGGERGGDQTHTADR